MLFISFHQIILILVLFTSQTKLLLSTNYLPKELKELEFGIKNNCLTTVQKAFAESSSPTILAINAYAIVKSLPNPDAISTEICDYLKPKIVTAMPSYKDLKKRRPELCDPTSIRVKVVEFDFYDEVVLLDAIVSPDGHPLNRYGREIKY